MKPKPIIRRAKTDYASVDMRHPSFKKPNLHKAMREARKKRKMLELQNNIDDAHK